MYQRGFNWTDLREIWYGDFHENLLRIFSLHGDLSTFDCFGSIKSS